MMRLLALLSSLHSLGVLLLCFFLALLTISSSNTCFSRLAALAQTVTVNKTTTDPGDARLVNSIFEKLNPSKPTTWNTSGELCTGSAVDSTDLNDANPGLKCDCTYNSSTLCHITGLRLYAMSLVGALPDELWNLTFLSNLDLRQNYFTGPIPTSIGRLTRMQYLSFGTNALSGQVPKELGMLTDLRSLSFSTNNFSGSLPAELGNLTRLSQIYFSSSGISGAIPPSFAKLQSLIIVWGSDTQLTGQIPDFIGNWSRLNVLKLQGNSFQGKIPSSFSNLTSLTDLRISELSNASISFKFIRKMTSLSTLVLRNNNISGSIPSYIGELKNLKHLDLSFNNLSGSIPGSLFNATALVNLFLGNNKLTGSLPQQKGSNLQNIDLSYNELSGSFPSWVNDQNLQVNLVANNFTFSESDSSNLPSGLNCLQRKFPCFRGSPIFYNFSIRCGGPDLRSNDGILYEADNETLGPATYYTTSSRRWAVSNAGFPMVGQNPRYTATSLSQFTNTLNPEIFQYSRISAGSLRYYGLGLETGSYNVSLQFAESQIENPTTWQSHGRRVFDIYIQGNLVEKDFDIKKASGGLSLYAVQMTFTVNVSENYLEVHLFWAGKGTCCVPYQGAYGPIISAISATPNFVPSVSNILPTPGKKDQTGLIVGIIVPIGMAIFVSVFAVYLFIQRRKMRNRPEEEGKKRYTNGQMLQNALEYQII